MSYRESISGSTELEPSASSDDVQGEEGKGKATKKAREVKDE